jgi:hypothetical protein
MVLVVKLAHRGQACDSAMLQNILNGNSGTARWSQIHLAKPFWPIGFDSTTISAMQNFLR